MATSVRERIPRQTKMMRRDMRDCDAAREGIQHGIDTLANARRPRMRDVIALLEQGGPPCRSDRGRVEQPASPVIRRARISPIAS